MAQHVRGRGLYPVSQPRVYQQRHREIHLWKYLAAVGARLDADGCACNSLELFCDPNTIRMLKPRFIGYVGICRYGGKPFGLGQNQIGNMDLQQENVTCQVASQHPVYDLLQY